MNKMNVKFTKWNERKKQLGNIKKVKIQMQVIIKYSTRK